MIPLPCRHEAKTRPETVASDVEFHDALLACANNMLLMPFGLIIEQALSTIFRVHHPAQSSFFQGAEMHEGIVRAVAAGDGKAAHAAMQTLLNDTDGVIDRAHTPAWLRRWDAVARHREDRQQG